MDENYTDMGLSFYYMASLDLILYPCGLKFSLLYRGRYVYTEPEFPLTPCTLAARYYNGIIDHLTNFP